MIGQELARKVRLLVLDVDGVLTDNGIYLGLVNGARIELKRFDIQDGLGLSLLRGTTIEVVWLSARPSEATMLRGDELKIGTVIQAKSGRKLPLLRELVAQRGLDLDAVCFVGDDLADLPVMERVGLPVAVSNAIDEVLAVATWVTAKAGGHGAVREVVEGLLKARGEWDQAIARYREGQE